MQEPDDKLIFISYCRKDPSQRARVTRLAKVLRDAGYLSMCDEWKPAHEPWWKFVERMVKSAFSTIIASDPYVDYLTQVSC